MLSIEERIKVYNDKNNSFNKKLIYHVGSYAGFHSEVDAMMQCMLYCYKHEIKFILYADDANFSGGHGWEEFFEPFCELNHDPLNHKYNNRYIESNPILKLIQKIGSDKIKKNNNVDLLTQDIFRTAINKKISTTEEILWPELGINGPTFTEFGKISDFALRYNKKTKEEVDNIISSLNLPSSYYSIQLRGGDKLTEKGVVNDIDIVVDRILKYDSKIDNLFVFSDDYRYVDEIKNKLPNTNIYTLCDSNDKGYDNVKFNNTDWSYKRKKMINLFAMIDICFKSKVHFGNNTSCINNYISSIRNNNEVYNIWTKEDVERIKSNY